MTDIHINIVNQQQFTDFAPERLAFSVLPTSSFISATVNSIEPGVTQTPHYHERPQGGEEVIFVYQGSFELTTSTDRRGPFYVERDGPVYIHVPSNIQASIGNIGEIPVRFLSIFAPPFILDELKFLE